MPSNSETILTNQAHVGDSSLQSHTGAKYKGDGYYGRSDGFHSVQYTVTGFQGKLDMQATLAINPVEADWFTITGTNLTSVDPIHLEFILQTFLSFLSACLWILLFFFSVTQTNEKLPYGSISVSV